MSTQYPDIDATNPLEPSGEDIMAHELAEYYIQTMSVPELLATAKGALFQQFRGLPDEMLAQKYAALMGFVIGEKH